MADGEDSPAPSPQLGNTASISDPNSGREGTAAEAAEFATTAATASASLSGGSGARPAGQGRSQAACRVPDCTMRLLLAYNQRHRICRVHQKATAIDIQGEAWRYCQQCAKLQLLECFDGDKRSCRESLGQQKARRQQSQQRQHSQQQDADLPGPSGAAAAPEAPYHAAPAAQQAEPPIKRQRVATLPSLPSKLQQQPMQAEAVGQDHAASLNILQQLLGAQQQQAGQQLYRQASSGQSTLPGVQHLQAQLPLRQSPQAAGLQASPRDLQLQQLAARSGSGVLHQPVAQRPLLQAQAQAQQQQQQQYQQPEQQVPAQVQGQQPSASEVMEAFHHRVSRLEGQVQALIHLLLGSPLPSPAVPPPQLSPAVRPSPGRTVPQQAQQAQQQQEAAPHAAEGDDLLGGMLSTLQFAAAQRAQQQQQHAAQQQQAQQQAQQQLVQRYGAVRQLLAQQAREVPQLSAADAGEGTVAQLLRSILRSQSGGEQISPASAAAAAAAAPPPLAGGPAAISDLRGTAGELGLLAALGLGQRGGSAAGGLPPRLQQQLEGTAAAMAAQPYAQMQPPAQGFKRVDSADPSRPISAFGRAAMPAPPPPTLYPLVQGSSSLLAATPAGALLAAVAGGQETPAGTSAPAVATPPSLGLP